MRSAMCPFLSIQLQAWEMFEPGVCLVQLWSVRLFFKMFHVCVTLSLRLVRQLTLHFVCCWWQLFISFSSQRFLWLPVWCCYSATERGPGCVPHPRTRYHTHHGLSVFSYKTIMQIGVHFPLCFSPLIAFCSLLPAPCPPSALSLRFLPDDLLSSQEKSSGMKDVIVSIDTSKDSDADSSKPSSKATSLQNSPAVQKGQPTTLHVSSFI